MNTSKNNFKAGASIFCFVIYTLLFGIFLSTLGILLNIETGNIMPRTVIFGIAAPFVFGAFGLYKAIDGFCDVLFNEED